jgi:hypothetical protein
MMDHKSQRREALRAFALLPTLTLALLLTGLWLTQPARAQQGTILRVKTDGTIGSGDCSDWANACQLQTALFTAQAGAEIWVASGVYTPGTTVTATFNLTAGVTLYGGFPSSGNPGWNDRDWATQITVLSGDIDDNDITDPNRVVTSTNNIQGSNAYHVVTADGASGTPITETTVLDGVTITAGLAKGSYGDKNDRGGGFYCQGNGGSTPDGCDPDDDNDGYTPADGDCDDNDDRVYPGQSSYFQTPRADDSFDFDCDGQKKMAGLVRQRKLLFMD